MSAYTVHNTIFSSFYRSGVRAKRTLIAPILIESVHASYSRESHFRSRLSKDTSISIFVTRTMYRNSSIAIGLMLWNKVKIVRNRSEKHFRQLDPVCCVSRRHKCFYEQKLYTRNFDKKKIRQKI